MPFPVLIYFVVAAVVRAVFRSLYGSRKYRKYVFERFRKMLYDIEAQHGGSINEWTSWVEYKSPDGVRIRATYRSRPLLKIFLPHSFSKSIYLYRIPPFVFSFFKPLLPRSAKIAELPYLAGGDGVANLEHNAVYRSILERLNRSRFSIRADSKGMTLTKSLRPEDGNEIPFLEMLRTVREFARLLDGPVIEIPVSDITSDSRCAYCKEDVLEQVEITHCLQCGTPHHRECFDLNAGCSVFGCNSKRQIEIPRQPEQLIHQ